MRRQSTKIFEVDDAWCAKHDINTEDKPFNLRVVKTPSESKNGKYLVQCFFYVDADAIVPA